MAHWIQRLRAKLYYVLGPYPSPFFLLWKILHPRADHHVHAQTEIVIEGYPRSSNSFADAAFRVAQLPEQVQQAHHVHAPAQIIRGVKRGLPCVVLIRPPEDAVVSSAIYDPENPLRHHLRAYNRFYRSLLPHQDKFVTGLFDEVTSDFGRVIRRVNDRFGTAFAGFTHTEQGEQEVLDILRKEGLRMEGEKFEARAAMPVETRKAEQERLKEALSLPEYGPLLDEARDLYRTYEGFADRKKA
jgi:hypothetical protein